MRQRWRLLAVGVFFVTLFGALALRLWYLQIGAMEVLNEEALSQQVLEVTQEAPRGAIYDRDGIDLAATRAAYFLMIDSRLIPEGGRQTLVRNLSPLLGWSDSEIDDFIDERSTEGRFQIGEEVSETEALFVMEHNEDFPGMFVQVLPIRLYPQKDIAAHVVGYIGAPNTRDLARPGISPQDRVGRFGIEGSYDHLLQGTPGRTLYRVNARGQIQGVIESHPPVPGGSVVSTIDLALQTVLEGALVDGMNLSRSEGNDPIRAAGVILDPRDGSVLALASVPAFDPSVFSDGQITEGEWASLSENAVLNNFAIQGLYPPASTFKIAAYTLALQWQPSLFPDLSVYPDPELAQRDYGHLEDFDDPSWFYADGAFDFPNTPLLKDWKPHGEVNINTSLQASSDQYYWGIALKIWNEAGPYWDENLLQNWSRALGFGSATGIDLPFEQRGLIPDREWFQHHQLEETGLVRLEGGWSAGDLLNVVIGQGAVTATPLQVANAYAALVNGGTLWRPRVVSEVVAPDGTPRYFNPPSIVRTLDLDQATVESLKSDLHGVVAGPRGTARVAFSEFCRASSSSSTCDALEQIGGKTGTAEIVIDTGDGHDGIDTAWFVGVAPLDVPAWVVAIVIDEGGSGGKIAAPVARAVLQYLMGESVTPIRGGDEDTE